MKELTLELTNFCEHGCKFCSSNAVNDMEKADYLSMARIVQQLDGKHFDRINLSGGEPLAHPNFYAIHKYCEQHADDVTVYSNLIKHRIYNAQVIDGVYLEADITVTPETDRVHILRRVKQGRETNRPEVKLSRNHCEDCSCDHRVLRYDGKLVRTPCDKYCEVENENV